MRYGNGTNNASCPATQTAKQCRNLRRMVWHGHCWQHHRIGVLATTPLGPTTRARSQRQIFVIFQRCVHQQLLSWGLARFEPQQI